MNRPSEEVTRKVRAARYNGEASPEEMQHELERTRSQMSETLDAIGRKFSPGEVLDHALGYMRAGPGEYFANLGKTARDNPLPLALLGISLAWLMMSGRRAEERRVEPGEAAYPVGDYPVGTYPATAYPGADYPLAGETVTVSEAEGLYPTPPGEEPGGEEHGKLRGTAERAGEKVGRMAHGIGEKAHGMGERISGAVGGIRGRAQSVRGRAGEQGRRLSGSLRAGSTRAAGASRRIYHDYPWVIAGIAAGIGAIMGSGLPRTRTEDRVMGPARDAVVETGREEAEKVRQTAGRLKVGAEEPGSESHELH